MQPSRSAWVAALLLVCAGAFAQGEPPTSEKQAGAQADAVARDTEARMSQLPAETKDAVRTISDQSKARAKTVDPRTAAAVNGIAADAKRRSLSQTDNPLDPGMKLAPSKKVRQPSILLQVLATESILSDTVDRVLVEAARLYAAYPDREITLRVLLRGLPVGAKTTSEAVFKLRDLSLRIKEAAPPASVSVVIDPRPFRDHYSNLAPHSILDVEDKPAVSVTGAVVGEWLMDQFTRGSRGRLGTIGETVEIVERDLREVIDERLAAIDWESKRDKAQSQFWSRQSRADGDFPAATKHRVREYDPTIEITDDLRTPAGLLIARKGQRINPLELKPYSKVLIMFDPAAAGQLERARAIGEAHPKPAKYLVTRMALPTGETGNKALARLHAILGLNVYRLDPRQFAVFGIEALPSVVEQSGKVWRITEEPVAVESASDTPAFPVQ